MSVAVVPGGPEFNRVLAVQMRRMVEHLIRGSSNADGATDPLRQSQMALNFLGKAQQLGDVETLVRLLEHFGGLLRGSSHAAVLDPFFESALASADLSNAQRVKLASLHALLFIIRGELDHAQAVLDAAWEAADSPLLQAELYNRLGVLLEVRGDFPASKEIYDKALGIAEALGDLRLMTWVHNNLGNWSYAQDDYEQALVHYQKALDVAEEMGDPNEAAQAEGGLAMTLTELGRYDKGVHYHQRARTHYQQVGNITGVVRTDLNLSYLFLHTGDYQKAKQRAGQALQIGRRFGNTEYEMTALHNLGRAYLLERDYEAAYSHLSKALEQRRWMGMPVFIEETEKALSDLSSALSEDPHLEPSYRAHLQAECYSALKGTQ